MGGRGEGGTWSPWGRELAEYGYGGGLLGYSPLMQTSAKCFVPCWDFGFTHTWPRIFWAEPAVLLR